MRKETPVKSGAASAVSAGGATLPPEVLKRTELENKKMEVAFKVFKLNDPPSAGLFEKRYLNIKHLC